MSNALLRSTPIIQTQSKLCSHCLQQTRNATLIRRPKRPYTFTQLVTLTDGSSYLHRTTSPQPVYRATKDIRNSLLWNPSSDKLRNVEEDEAGKLASFRSKFGETYETQETTRDNEASKVDNASNEGWDSLMDMLSTAGSQSGGTLTKSRSQVAKEKEKEKI